MKFEEAKNKVCPYINSKCILEDCMMWETTIKGKKEIDRVTEPYNMTPMSIRNWTDSKVADGYVEDLDKNGFRSDYVLFEETFEGHCNINKKLNN